MEGLDLSGKVALVSAGTRGIGEAITNSLAHQGATVIAFSRSAEPSSIQISNGGSIVTMKADSTNPQEVESLVNTVLDRYGKIDILINNAGGVPHFGPILSADLDSWDNSFDINLRSAFVLTRLVVNGWMNEHGGSIVNIASIAGLKAGTTGLGVYRVVKAGLIMFTKQLARELAGKNIRVNAIAPGYIKTEFSRVLWDNPQSLEAFLSTNLNGRLGTVDDVARATLFVASPAADYVNGEVLVVDGGSIA